MLIFAKVCIAPGVAFHHMLYVTPLADECHGKGYGRCSGKLHLPQNTQNERLFSS